MTEAHPATRSRSRRVLHLINGEYFGGSARVLMNYLEAAERSSEVVVGLLFDGELADRCRSAGVETMRIRMRGRWDLTPAIGIARAVSRRRFDMLHSHQPRNTLLGRIAAVGSGRPLVTHVHSPQFRESTHRLSNAAVGSVDRIPAVLTSRFVCVSESLAMELRRQSIGASRIRVVPNGVEAATATTSTERTAARAELGLPPEAFVVGMVANFRPRKGVDVLIEAFAELVRGGLDARLVLVGEPFREHGGDYGETLRAMIEASGCAARILQTGFRPDTDRVMRAFDAFVLPSRFGEGMPMVLLEAMVREIPVVSTPVEGIVEVVDDGVNGELVPVDDRHALANRLAELASDPARRARLAAAGRATVLDRFTTGAMARGIERVYDELVGSTWAASRQQ
ncbi:MAG TPA: glycosyltransferase family 4 protein [Candidatus Limnocylindrales bacterium]|nr:glycosyltransferase family 4 protein [Candidatus Limnocylindrales bacterium]